MTPNDHTPDTDAPNRADKDAAFPYSIRNRKNNKNNMTPNADYPNNDAPYSADKYAVSLDPLILDSSLKI